MKHKHHIVPKHMGGSDESSNIIELTIEEHAQAHKELYEQYGKNEDRLAWLMLTGQSKDPEFASKKASLGGKIQGKINAESGHLKRITKLVDHIENGKKGGAVTISKGKGSFADPVERLKSASKGGKTQGKINAESGHLKRITKLSSRTSGKMWITNGEINKMINSYDELPKGFRKGKIHKK